MADIAIIPIGVEGLRTLAAKYQTGVTARIGSAMTGLAKIAQKVLQSNTQGWNPPVNFSITGSFNQGQITVGTDDIRYKWVDDGTRRHVIRARRAKVLRFSSGYVPKTRPGSFIIGAGTRSGGMIYRASVNHPGIKARNISKRVQQVIDPQLERAVDRAIKEVLG